MALAGTIPLVSNHFSTVLLDLAPHCLASHSRSFPIVLSQDFILFFARRHALTIRSFCVLAR